MVASSPPDPSSTETAAHDCPRVPLSPPLPPRSAEFRPIDSESVATEVPSSTSDSHGDARATDMLLVAPTNLSPAETRTPGRRTIYLVRHAESRYNDATKNLSIRKIVGEYDHGLSTKGVDQCIVLRNRVIEAAERGDADALRIVNRDVTYSSPLSRAVLTAHLSLPEMATPVGAESDRKVKVRQDGNTGEQKQQGGEFGQERRSHVVIVIPDAREHCMLPVLSRDSIGTVKEKLNSKLNAELDDIRANCAARAVEAIEAKVKDSDSNEDSEVQKAAAVPVLDPHLLDPESFFVDTSHVTKSTWWKVGESGLDVTRRLQGLMRHLYDLSSDDNGNCEDDAGNGIGNVATTSDEVNENGTIQVEDLIGRKSTGERQGRNRTGGAIVLVGHSHVFRRLFREFGEFPTCDPNAMEDRTNSYSRVSTFSNGNADGTAAAKESDNASNGSNNDGSKNLIRKLGKQMITNCAVLRVTLSLKEGMESPTIVNAAFLFGTGFKNSK